MLAGAFAGALKSSGLGLLVPAYFPSGAEWTSLNQAAERVPLIAILNPNSGPGAAVNKGYVSAVNGLRRSQGRVIGYVSTTYGSRAVEEVRREIDRYYSFYEVDGIFLDEMTNDSNANHLAYYESIYRYVKARNSSHTVIGNPGSKAAAAYITRPVTDTLVTFENKTGYDQYSPDSWTKTQIPAALAHLCYAVTDSTAMTNFIHLAVSRNTGYIYVTDDGGNNPWDRLPAYWIEEVGLVESINREAARARRAELKIDSTGLHPVRIDVSGVAGRYVLQRSNNLSIWQPEATNLSATGSFSFDLPQQADARAETFRTEQ